MNVNSPSFSRPANPSSGFTLVELSVVLVVLGLIVGGVLVGGDLIAISKARSVMSQVAEIDAAVSAFQTKYNCLPGDCPKADQYNLGGAGGFFNGNGNGDGAISGLSNWVDDLTFNKGDGAPAQPPFTLPNLDIYGESGRFWIHLFAAGMIGGTAIDLPNDAFGNAQKTLGVKGGSGGWWVVTWNGQTYYRPGLVNTGAGYIAESSGLNATQAGYILSKLNAPLLITALGGNFDNTVYNGYPDAMQQKLPVVLSHGAYGNNGYARSFYITPFSWGGSYSCTSRTVPTQFTDGGICTPLFLSGAM